MASPQAGLLAYGSSETLTPSRSRSIAGESKTVDCQVSRRIQQRSCVGFAPTSLFTSIPMEAPESPEYRVPQPGLPYKLTKTRKNKSHNPKVRYGVEKGESGVSHSDETLLLTSFSEL